MKKVILTADAPAPIGPYSQAIQQGPFLFCSGQIPIDPKSGNVVLGPIEDQAELVLKNIQALLKAAGCSFVDVMKSTIFLTNMGDFAKVNEVYGKYFTEQPAARSTIQVAALPKGVNVEIEVVAYRN